MRISNIIGLGTSAIIFAVIAVAFFTAIWLCGYKLIYIKAMHGEKQISAGKMGQICIFAVYIVVVLYVTVLRSRMGAAGTGHGNLTNWKPFSSYKEAWYNFSTREWRNLILNICMFVPMGFLVPVCFKKFAQAWKVYLCGFAFTVFIEIFQLVSGRGVFETDDIINNTVGAMIGYGLFAVVKLIKCKNNRKTCILAQIPLVLTIAGFVTVFTIYANREYGNLSIDNIARQDVTVSLADGVKLSDKAENLDVYTIPTVTEAEAEKLAKSYFSKYGVEIDDSQTDKYDDTIIFHSTKLDAEGNTLSVWCDYEEPTVNFTDFSQMGDSDNTTNDAGNTENTYDSTVFTEEYVRDKLENLGVFIPQNAIFSEDERYDAGKFAFTDDGEVLDDGLYYKGTIECCLTPEGGIESFRDNLIKYTPYKKVNVISEKEAYDRISTGKFFVYTSGENLSRLVVKSVNISYMSDSKGYYRPVYEFVADTDQAGDGNETGSIMVDALMY